MKQNRFAILGTGSMAETAAATFARMNVPVSAVFSNDRTRAREFATKYRIESSYSFLPDLLRDPNIAAVYIANASSEHATATIHALEAGKAVLCEKPLATSVEACEQVAFTARKTNTLCMEAIWTLCLPAYKHFVTLANSRRYGKPEHLFVDFGYPNQNERLLSAERGGVMLDRAIYPLALALKLFGEVERVDAKLTLSEAGVDHQATLQLSHQTGEQSQICASFTSLLSNHARLSCTDGSISLEPPLLGAEVISTERSRIDIDAAAQAGGLKSTVKEFMRRQPIMRSINRSVTSSKRTVYSYGPDRYAPQLKHFLSLLRTGKSESDVVPLKLSVNIQKIIASARSDSLRQGI
jgi:predicted dehydrogenase